MALIAVAHSDPSEVYIAGLRSLIGATNPLLLHRDRWGFHTLRECFGIEATSAIYVPEQFTEDRLESLVRRGRELAAERPGSDDFLGGVGYDFGGLREPYKTELKAYFFWRLSRLEGRSYSWHGRSVRLIRFIADTSASAGGTDPALPRHLIDFGHPIEDGNGNASTPLRALMENWLAATWVIDVAPDPILPETDFSRGHRHHQENLWRSREYARQRLAVHACDTAGEMSAA